MPPWPAINEAWRRRVATDKSLPLSARQVGGLLATYFNQCSRVAKHAFVGTLADSLGVSHRTVQRGLKALEERGHIMRRHGAGCRVPGAPGHRATLYRMTFGAAKLSTDAASGVTNAAPDLSTATPAGVTLASPKPVSSLLTKVREARARATETTTDLGACQTRARPEISDPAATAAKQGQICTCLEEKATVTPEEQAASRARIEDEMRAAGIPVFPRNRPVADQQADPEPLPELPAAPATAALPETPEEWAAFRARQYELLRIGGFREVIIGRQAPEPAAAPVLPSQIPADRVQDAEKQRAPAPDVALEAARTPGGQPAAVPEPEEALRAASEPPRTPVGGSAAVPTAPATRRQCPSRSGPTRPWRFIHLVYAATGENRLDTT